MKERGVRYNQGKVRVDLVYPEVVEAIAEVLGWACTDAERPYPERNWEKGMKWSIPIASAERHFMAFKKGIDVDVSGKPHLYLILANIAMLLRYSKTHQQLDDRDKPFLRIPKVALDIDGIIADFNSAWQERFGYGIDNNNNWHFGYGFRRDMDVVVKDKGFWMNIKPIVSPSDIPFEPVCYITNRAIPIEWTQEWIEANGFSCVPVYASGGNKSEYIEKNRDKIKHFDVFVDDNFYIFSDLNNKGIFTYLMSAKYNEKYDVGKMRINKLSDIVKNLL